MTESPEEVQAPRRAFSRLQLGIAAQLETLDGRQRIRLVNLSQAGAHIVLDKPAEIHAGVLTWLRFETFGSVVWRNEEHVGLEFDKLLPPRVLVETRQLAPDIVREEEEAAARDFVAGISSLD